ncbi:MAG: fused MFS/spermidine synthase [bacterium]
MRERVHVASVSLSAFLLFLLQPILARLLLPVHGGSPAVWNTCMVFFQMLLLAGYAYAHGSLRLLGFPRQAALHAVLLVASLFFLPRALASIGAGTMSPVPSILLALMLTAGIPFFVLSTNSSLTQRWFSLSSFERSADPFWLYAASNVGSLIALLSYPLIVEPALGLHAQLRYWSIGYGLFVALALASMLVARRGMTAASVDVSLDASVDTVKGDSGATPVTARRRLGWVLRSAVASSLLLSVTMQISTDVISAPLFWVLPLALYLATFIVAFSPSLRPQRSVVAYTTRVGIALCFVLVVVPTLFPFWFALLVLLGTLFAGALLCNGDLADDRPSARDLTDFYLWLAVGGMLGGLANSIVAPLVFKSVAEYPATLVCVAIVLQARRHGAQRFSLGAMRDLATSLPAVLMVVATAVAAMIVWREHAHNALGGSGGGILRWQFMPLAVLTCGVLFARQPGVFPLSTMLVAAFVLAGFNFIDPIVDQGRSFFGVSRVTETADQRIMIHGVTVHGAQRKDPALRDIPTSYYYPRGPLGWAMGHMPPDAVIGVIGLGAGSLAPLAQAGQRVTFYEIDPLVEAMARRDFTYLADSKATVDVKIGDGRRLIEGVADDHFDLLIIDAFNSDAIPTHLLTEEALALYLQKLKPSGLLVMHISNRYADLTRVFRGWAETTRQRVAVDQFVPTAEEQHDGVGNTVAVALARSPSAFARLVGTKQWYWLDQDGPAVHWTDDHVNLLAVLDKNVLKP